MTDQLETDLRAMLAARASEVTADAAGGEAAVAARLQTGDAALAEVVPLARPRRSPLADRRRGGRRGRGRPRCRHLGRPGRRHRRCRHGSTPEAPAAIFTGVGSPESVAGTYVFDRLDLPPDQQLDAHKRDRRTRCPRRPRGHHVELRRPARPPSAHRRGRGAPRPGGRQRVGGRGVVLGWCLDRRDQPHGHDHHGTQHRTVGELPRAQRAPARRHVDLRRRVRRRRGRPVWRGGGRGARGL